jgi:arylsulfatase A-like enzyme
MNRSLVLLSIACLLGLPAHSVAAGEEPAATGAPRRPNILFCFADDWCRYASAYAAAGSRPSPSQVVKTPNIDGVARRGVLFNNAFVNAPSCTPCRSSLLSGRYFFNTGRGAILNEAVWDTSIPSWPLLLEKTGYHIGKLAKVWSPGTPVDAPFGGQTHAYERAGNAYSNFSENATKAMRSGVPLAAAKQKLLDEVRGNFEAFLADRKDAAPWLYWFGPTLVHRVWEKGSGQALWGIDPEALRGKLPRFLPDVPDVRADFADYLGEIQAWDAGIGVLLEALDRSGERDRTVIVISGDHGAPGFPGGKCNLYDFGVGVSLVVTGPGIAGGRTVDDLVSLIDLAPTLLEFGGATRPPGVSGRSLTAILKSDRSGQVDPARTWVITGRERHVAAARDSNLPYPQRALRTREFLYIRNFKPDRWPLGNPKAVTDTEAPPAQALESNTYVAFADMDASPTKAWLVAHRNDPEWRWFYQYAFGKRPAEELYDLRTDPDQVKNLAEEPSYAAARRELSDRLMTILSEAGDPRLEDAFDHPPFVAERVSAP